MPDFLFEPVPYTEAVDFLKSKPALARAAFDKLLPDLKARAFTITGIEAADTLQRCRDTIATLPAGGDWNKIKKSIVGELSPYFVDPSADADTQKKQTGAANRRAELLIRTHGQQAYAAGTYAMLESQRDIFPYWQYLTCGDDHVRPTHAALDKIVLPANHEFWKSHYPPWDWGCRCTVAPVSDHDKKEIEKKDAKRPTDQRQVLDTAEQNELTLTRRIARHGVAYNVTAPSEMGKPGAFQWHPGNLRIPLHELKGRYDASTWGFFESWARKQHIQEKGGTTVWEWLKGKAVTPAVPIPAPAAAAATEPHTPAHPHVTPPVVAAAHVRDVATLSRSAILAGKNISPGDVAKFCAAHHDDPIRDALSHWTGAGYAEMNENPGSERSKLFDKVMRAMQPEKCETSLFRGLHFENENELNKFVSGIQKAGGFENTRLGMSASRQFDTAKNFADAYPEGVVLEIRKSHSARNLDEIRNHGLGEITEEKEMVFLKGSKFTLLESKEFDSGAVKLDYKTRTAKPKIITHLVLEELDK